MMHRPPSKGRALQHFYSFIDCVCYYAPCRHGLAYFYSWLAELLVNVNMLDLGHGLGLTIGPVRRDE